MFPLRALSFNLAEARSLLQEPVVFVMRANSEESPTVPGTEGAMIVSDSCGLKIVPDLFEAEGAVPRIIAPEGELLIGTLNLGR